MTLAGAKSIAKLYADKSANPPCFATVATNGPNHEHVVHVTFGEPKQQTKTDRNGNETTSTPKRPRPFTVA